MAKDQKTLSFASLYKIQYDLVLNRKGEALYAMIDSLLGNYMKSHVRLCINVGSSDEELLRTLYSALEEVLTTSSLIRDVALYLERTYVKMMNLPKVIELALRYFMDIILRASDVHSRMTLLEGPANNSMGWQVLERMVTSVVTGAQELPSAVCEFSSLLLEMVGACDHEAESLLCLTRGLTQVSDNLVTLLPSREGLTFSKASVVESLEGKLLYPMAKCGQYLQEKIIRGIDMAINRFFEDDAESSREGGDILNDFLENFVGLLSSRESQELAFRIFLQDPLVKVAACKSGLVTFKQFQKAKGGTLRNNLWCSFSDLVKEM